MIDKIIIYADKKYKTYLWHKFLKEKFNFNIEIKDDVFRTNLNKLDYISRKLASIRVKDPNREKQPDNFFPAEVEYEKRRIKENKNVFGIVYDGFGYIEILREFIKNELKMNILNIVITDQLIATFDENDFRWHLRTAIFSFPTLISIPGIVEAPAKPKEFYILLQQGIDKNILIEKFKERILTLNDERINEVVKGFLVQAVFYHLTGEPFCNEKFCRLYNAHWQEELLYSQIKSKKEFCDFHNKQISKLKNEKT